MKCNKLTSKSLVKVLACTIVALGAINLAQAQTVDPSGTYTWVQPAGRGGGGGGRRGGGGGGTNTLVLKLADGKLTGTLTAPAGGGRGGRRRGAPPADGAPPPADAAPATPPPAPTPINITDAKWDAATATVSFKVSRPGRGGGDPIVIPYTGKLSGTTITGTITMPGRGGGDPTEQPWTATKATP